MKMIITSECLECEYGSVCENNNQKVHCSYKNKDYFFGQRIPCEDKNKKNGDIKNNEQNSTV